MNARTLGTATLIALLALASACRRDAKPEAPRKPKVALIMKSLANEFFQTMEAGAKAHQAAHAGEYDLVANGIKDEQDVGKQIDLVEQMVAQGVDAIVLAPADSKALVAAVKRARDAGVVVVNIDNRLDQALLAERKLTVPFVGPSNRKGARAVAEALARTLPAGAEVAILEGLPTAENARERRAGFEEALTAAKLNVVAVQAGNWEMAKANQLTAALLNEHPKLAAVLCANDSMVLGAVAALKAAGRAGQVKVVGFDNIAAVAALVKTGEVLATADQHGGELAVFGIEAALDVLRKNPKTAPLGDREMPVDVVLAKE